MDRPDRLCEVNWRYDGQKLSIIFCSNLRLEKLPYVFGAGDIEVGNNVFIGLGAIILPGVTIGDNVIIGAGSVVTQNIPSNSVAAGTPAKVLKSIDAYELIVKDDLLMTKNLSASEKRAYLENRFYSK